MSRKPARFLRAVARFLNPIRKAALAELRKETLERLNDDDVMGAWVRSKAEAFDEKYDFSDFPVIGEHLELWDRDAAEHALWFAVEQAREELKAAA